MVEIIKIIEATARQFGMPSNLICDYKNRTREVSYARHLAMYLSRHLTFKSHFVVSQELGCNRSAVTYACQQIEKALNNDRTKADISSITKRLKPPGG